MQRRAEGTEIRFAWISHVNADDPIMSSVHPASLFKLHEAMAVRSCPCDSAASAATEGRSLEVCVCARARVCGKWRALP